MITWNLLINSSVNRNVQLSVIDMSGRVIETLNTDLQNGGEHSFCA